MTTTSPSTSRAGVSWRVKGGGVLGPAPFLVCGILNATPDSFYDGGRNTGVEAAVAHGRFLLGQGADVLDVGGESTRPGAPPVEADEELSRVLPVLRELAAEASVAVDTVKASVAAACLEAGAVIVNDVSAARLDPGLTDVLTQYKPGYVLMHMLGEPRTMQLETRYDDVVDDVRSFLAAKMDELVRAGLPEDRIVLDPGIGFGKSLEHNLELLQRIDEVAALGRPVYMGLSNKSWLGKLLGAEPGDRPPLTATASALLQARGVRIHRVHEVGLVRSALLLAEEMSP
ncbi:dihydropteroate synthase [Desulfohalovibrio reitneri]|uniref:dihydropteroate synthase n=1 Tax=Desulfohalovibrio reitneri TaxID=1307759 RepID=UPI00068FDC63|nr:dihydropteroate synthase [Desulfohalovibrio reitneri]